MLEMNLDGIEPRRRSVSQFNTFMQCAEMYRLQRVAHVRQKPAAWLPMGTAIHEVLEEWEKWGRVGTVEEAQVMFAGKFTEQVEELAESSGYDYDEWLTGSKKLGSTDIAERLIKGQEHVARYIEWANSTSNEWRIATLDGRPALELEFDIELGGVKVKGFIDQVVETASGVIYPRDIKSGSRRPETPFQLAVYAVALGRLYGIECETGAFAMTKEAGAKIEHFEPLHRWSEDMLSTMFHHFNVMELAGLYIPEPGAHCRTCPVVEYCRVMGDPERSSQHLEGVLEVRQPVETGGQSSL